MIGASLRGGEDERGSSPLFVLYLAMEYVLYSLSSIARVGHLLHREDEEYAAYSNSITRRLQCEEEMCHTPCPPAHDGG